VDSKEIDLIEVDSRIVVTRVFGVRKEMGMGGGDVS
jgi:hypothetical protein